MTDIDRVERTPTKIEEGQEAPVFYTVIADTVFIAAYAVVAVMTGSLTVISDVIRGSLMLIASVFGYWVMRAAHRDRLRRFEFGIGKLEQFVALVTGIGLIVSAFWVGNTVIEAVFADSHHAASPFGLAAAAVTNAINALINVLGWYAMVVAARGEDGGVFKTQIRVRFTMLVGSLFIQATLTAAALAKDPALALMFDATGAIFIVGLMLLNGVSMILRALPDLLDSPAANEMDALIRRTVADFVPPEADIRVRTRCSGRTTFAEIAVVNAPSASAATLRNWRTEIDAALDSALERAGAKVEVSVIAARG